MAETATAREEMDPARLAADFNLWQRELGFNNLTTAEGGVLTVESSDEQMLGDRSHRITLLDRRGDVQGEFGVEEGGKSYIRPGKLAVEQVYGLSQREADTIRSRLEPDFGGD